MRLICKYGSGYIGMTNNRQEVILYEWHNIYLLMKHIHYLRTYSEAFEETEEIEIDVDIKIKLI